MARGPRATITHDAAASPFASRGSERRIQMERLSTPPLEILPGQQGHTPPRPARRLRLRGRLTRATTDSHRAAPLTRLASGASTQHQPYRPLRAGSPSGPSPQNAAPPPSLSQSRAKLRLPDCGREELACSRGGRERAERLRSAARDLTRTTPPDFIASPLHRLDAHHGLLHGGDGVL
jgi:hypothetical protein